MISMQYFLIYKTKVFLNSLTIISLSKMLASAPKVDAFFMEFSARFQKHGFLLSWKF